MKFEYAKDPSQDSIEGQLKTAQQELHKLRSELVQARGALATYVMGTITIAKAMQDMAKGLEEVAADDAV